MSGPIRFMILAILSIKESLICLFRKDVVCRSIHSYRVPGSYIPKSDFLACLLAEASIRQSFFRDLGIKMDLRRLYQMNAIVYNPTKKLAPTSYH